VACLAPALRGQLAHFANGQVTVLSNVNEPEGVAVDGSGNLYLANRQGVLKETPSNGAYTERFIAGANSLGGIAVDSSGNVYVPDVGSGTLRKETPNGGGGFYTESTIATGIGLSQGVAVDGNGNVYVTSFPSSESPTGYLVKVTPNGGGYTQSTIATGFSEPGGVAVDANGTVYVVELDGLAILTPSVGGYTTNVVPEFFLEPVGVVLDGSGNLYVGDSQRGLLKLTPNGSSYSVSQINIGLTSPIGAAIDGAGNIYVVDQTNTLHEVTGRVLKVFFGAADFGPVPVGTPSFTTTLTYSFDVNGATISAPAVVTQGVVNADFTDAGTGSCATNGPSHLYNVHDTCTVDAVFTPSNAGMRMGAVVPTFAPAEYLYGVGVGPQIGFSPPVQSLIGADQNLAHPTGVAVDGFGNVYFTDTTGGRVFKATPSGGAYTTNKIITGIAFPTGVAVDGAGSVYVADSNAPGILKKYTLNGGVYAEDQFGIGTVTPRELAVDKSGNLYIIDAVALKVVKETFNGGGYSQSVILSLTTQEQPNFVAVDNAGNVYVSEGTPAANSSRRVVKETPNGSGYTESVVASGFGNAQGVAVDDAGNVYIADGPAAAVFKETLSGGTYTPSTLPFSGITRANGLAVDGSRNVYLIDNPDAKVLALNYANPPSLSFATSAVGTQSSDSPQSFTVMNNGNADLQFSIPASSSNPLLTSGFTLDSATTCPEVDASSASVGVLSAGASCQYAVDFIPTVAGLNTGSLTLTDNNLNASNAAQNIGLSGNGTGTAPTIITNPSSQTVNAGQTAIFIAAASGAPTPTVQWQVSTDGGSTFVNVPGANATLLSVLASAGMDGYRYQAVFTNAIGSATTTAATLTVQTAPTVTTNPVSQTVNAGEIVAFTAAASGNPTPTVQWQVSANGGPFTNVPNATSTTLSFTTTGAMNGSQYQAVFTNAAGSATTSAATLTVQTAPTITTNPSSQTVNAGQTAVFIAAASGVPTPTVQWQVSTDGGSTFVNMPNATSTTLSFVSAANMDGNRYQAVFTNAVGVAVTTSATLTVQSAPTITTNPVSQTVSAGTLVVFTAAASGKPTPTVQWQVSTNGGPFTNVPGGSFTTLSFTATAAMNGNEYQAVFTNSVGSATTSAATLTTQIAPAITTNPVSQTVNAGQVAAFTAAASGTPTPTVQWQVSANGGPFTNVPGGSSTTLSFTATAAMNGNQYQAVFTNVAGSAITSAATLTVQSPPSITLDPANQAVPAGQTATFSAAASGTPAPTVQWQVSANGGPFANIPGALSAVLTLTANDSMTGNQYRAVFTNIAGSATTTAATLTVEDFTITATPPAQTIPSGHVAEYTINLASLRGLAGSVALSCTGGPPNSTCSINPGSADLNGTAVATLTLLPPMNVNHGTFTLTFTGSLDGIVHSASVTLTVK